MASSLSAPLAPAAAIDYPSSDGKPMAESDSQRKPLTYAVDCLGYYFRNHPDVYVSGNLLIYYEEGTRARVAPDVFGAGKEERASYLLWKEPKAPDFVLEIASPGTWRDDQTWKRELYRRLGVGEYWQYDPTRNYLQPPLQGLELEVLRSADRRGAAELGGGRRRTPGGGGPRGAGSGRPPPGGSRPPSRRNPRPPGGGRPPSRGNPRPPGSGCPPSGRSAAGRTRGIITPQIRLTLPTFLEVPRPVVLQTKRMSHRVAVQQASLTERPSRRGGLLILPDSARVARKRCCQGRYGR